MTSKKNNNKPTEQYSVLIVDDEPDIRELLEITLSRMNLATQSAENLQKAKDMLSQNTYSLCLSDMRLPDGSGLDLLKHIQQHYSAMPVAVITAFGSMESAIESLKAGAFDFVSKPVDLGRLRDLVNAALKLSPDKAAVDDTSSQKPQVLIGETESIRSLRAQISKLARSQAPIYIYGESGSGKEIVAKQIHEQGPRAEAPFIAVNCGAIPSELMESEFFGHVKGSFTGASANKEGLFQAAQGGSFFLDEVADLPLSMQVKLLRAIQEKAVRPVGATGEVPIDVRIISASHKDLNEEVSAGNFRQDLYYRINVIQLNVPSLRERRDDISLLADFFIRRIAKQWGVSKPKISKQALNALKAYNYPGNVRELENTIERAIALSESGAIELEHLQLPDNTMTQGKKLAGADDEPSQISSVALEDRLSGIEKEAILQALEETSGNKTAAAKKLGMTFRSLRYRLKKLGLDDD